MLHESPGMKLKFMNNLRPFRIYGIIIELSANETSKSFLKF